MSDRKLILLVVCCHRMVSLGQSITWRSPSLSRSNTWPLGSSWNPSAHLALVFVLWRYPPSDAVLTPAISPITGRLVEGGSIFLPVQVQRTCSQPWLDTKQKHDTNMTWYKTGLGTNMTWYKHELVSWCFEPRQPQRIISEMNILDIVMHNVTQT